MVELDVDSKLEQTIGRLEESRAELKKTQEQLQDAKIHLRAAESEVCLFFLPTQGNEKNVTFLH